MHKYNTKYSQTIELISKQTHTHTHTHKLFSQKGIQADSKTEYANKKHLKENIATARRNIQVRRCESNKTKRIHTFKKKKLQKEQMYNLLITDALLFQHIKRIVYLNTKAFYAVNHIAKKHTSVQQE